MAEMVARSSGSGEDATRAVARLGGAAGVDPTPTGTDNAGDGAPAHKWRLPVQRRTSSGGRGRRLQREWSSARRAVEVADDAKARMASSSGGPGGGAAVGEDDEQRHDPSRCRRGAVTPASSSGSGNGTVNDVEQRRGGALPDRSIPDETQQQWTMRRDFDEARRRDGLLAKKITH
ncbi:hypothetical protein Scep_016904 [Stephania cephalantha]|uniref:Uncharacterized protein n=1 Tax=Stephania cephalantha TaxID=152367 RepID=A0AAP0NWD7_9MAGN